MFAVFKIFPSYDNDVWFMIEVHMCLNEKFWSLLGREHVGREA